MEHKKILRLTQCALIAALAYVGFQFLRIDIPVGTERTAIHLGNTFVVIGALLLGGWGGFATTLVARKFFHIEKEPGIKAQTRIALCASAVSLGCNVVLDPLFGYFYKAYIFGIPQDLSAALSKIGSATTLVNAVASTVMVFLLWPALYTALARSGKLPWASADEHDDIVKIS